MILPKIQADLLTNEEPLHCLQTPVFSSFFDLFLLQKHTHSALSCKTLFSYFIVRRTNRAQIPYKTTAIHEKSNDTVFRPVFQLIVLTIL